MSYKFIEVGCASYGPKIILAAKVLAYGGTATDRYYRYHQGLRFILDIDEIREQRNVRLVHLGFFKALGEEIMRVYGLVVRSYEDSSCYHRVGVFNADLDILEDFQVRLISIV